MYTRGVVAVAAICLLFAADSFAGQAGGGGGRGGGMRGGGMRGGAGMRGGQEGNGPNRNRDGEMEDERNVDFQSSLSEAEGFAENKDVPVMAFIGDGTPNDKKWLDRLDSWPQLHELSRTKLAVVQLSEKKGSGKEIAQSLKLRAPSLAFLDKYGNAMLGTTFPDSIGPITNVVTGWKGLMTNVENFFKDHVTRGDRLLNSGKIKTAYLEYELVAPFKGPEPTKAKEGMKKIEDQWLRLLEIGSRMPAGGSGQQAIYKGLRKDTLGTSFAASMESFLKDPNAAVAARNGGVAPTAAAPTKSLSEATRGSVSSAASSDSSEDANSGIDYGVLSKSSDERLKKADLLLKEGVTEYKKATAESMERGPARNELLQNARTKFEQVLTLCEEAQKAGSSGLDKIMEKTSMLMYGALKYQSL